MWRRITPYARYVALFGAACLVIGLGAWLVAGLLKPWIEIVGVLGLVLLALSVIMQPQQAKSAILGRRTRYGSNAVLMSVALFVIIALLNFLGTRYHKRWDVTAEKQFSLSEQTVQILKGIQEPVKAVLFFTPNNANRQSAEDLIKEYAIQTRQLTYQIVDPEIDRVTALNYQVTRDGTIIFERGDRREVTFGAAETDLTGALLKVFSDKVRGVYFLTGHGERNPDVADGTGCSTIKQVLESENYKVGTFTFAITDTVPADAVAVVIAGPTEPLTQQEVDLLGTYVENGGHLMVLYEPGMADPLLGLLQRYGIDIQDDLVIDPTSAFYGDIATPVVQEYVYHQITKDLTGLPSLFPTVRDVRIMDTVPSDWTITQLATSSGDAWAETDYQSSDVGQDADEVQGPLTLGVAVEPSTTDTRKGRLVVIGDSDFMGDNLLSGIRGGIGNVDLFMNSVGWLAEEESLIAIRPQELADRTVVLTPPQARGIIYSSLLFAPIVVLLIGGYVWWKRR
jgi:ABC-type uncharacterized transport system involved in gliding motility auxiliary subunit